MIEDKKELREKICEETEKKIEEVLKQGLQTNNVDMLYTLVDIHKDIANEEYWEKKEENMKYRNYGEGGNYGARGSYSEYGEYGARGRSRDRRGRYKGEETMEDMHRSFQDYSEGKERYERGSYGAKEDSMKSLEYLLECMVEFVEMLKKDATNQEEIAMIKHYTKKISEM